MARQASDAGAGTASRRPAAEVMPALPKDVAVVREAADGDGLYRQRGWQDEMPWLVQGITGDRHDMSLYGGAPVGEVLGRWQTLRDRLECAVVIHARQVHEATVLVHDAVPAGMVVAPDADGHATARAGILLAVAVADCVPIYLAAPDAGAIALLHGGWRGVAADILEHGISTMSRRFAVDREQLRVHFGPAICGECFEVGPEVPRALGLTTSPAPTHVDVRATLAHRAMACGVPAPRITTSGYCTRHGDSPFFSHRGGCGERQIAVLAIRSHDF